MASLLLGSSVFAAQSGEGDLQPTEGYASCLHAYGVKIEASEGVERDWLYLSALVYEHMTAYETRYEIRETLEENGFRILLAREHQTLDTLPEYEGDEGAREAGGLGGNPGEYRVALRVGHPHVLIHELAHGIYHSAIQFQELDGSTDPEAGDAPPKEGTFSHELYVAYDAAMEAELWQHVRWVRKLFYQVWEPDDFAGGKPGRESAVVIKLPRLAFLVRAALNAMAEPAAEAR